jgi:hypothetical protein
MDTHAVVTVLFFGIMSLTMLGKIVTIRQHNELMKVVKEEERRYDRMAEVEETLRRRRQDIQNALKRREIKIVGLEDSKLKNDSPLQRCVWCGRGYRDGDSCKGCGAPR